jgi:hypothetical protein
VSGRYDLAVDEWAAARRARLAAEGASHDERMEAAGAEEEAADAARLAARAAPAGGAPEGSSGARRRWWSLVREIGDAVAARRRMAEGDPRREESLARHRAARLELAEVAERMLSEEITRAAEEDAALMATVP